MKRVLVLFLMVSFVTIGYAQKSVITEANEQIQNMDSLTEEQKDLLFFVLEKAMVSVIDSITDEGRYMQALDMIDSLQVYWNTLTDRPLSLQIYLKKGNILMSMEEWRGLIATTEECLSVFKLVDKSTYNADILNRGFALLYSMQGNGHRNLGEYKDAIHSYENAVRYYTEMGDLGGVGGMLCNMAFCYMSLKKYIMASSFFQKGLDKYLNYFETTRSALLKDFFYTQDSYEQTVLALFGEDLLLMAVFEQDYGDKSASKNYLLMSAHCGNERARGEYLRIYGR